MDLDALIIISITLFIGYMAGSIPFGLILTKLFTKQDIRKIGSGNIGATNVLRTGNKKLATLTLLLDASKGAMVIVIAVGGIPTLKSENMFFSVGFFISYAMLLGLGAVIGHCFPIWLKFKGGKGVATALGVLLTAVPYAGLVAIITWIITAKITKISSLSALIAIGISPIITFFIYGFVPTIICALITLLVWIRHKDNIKRLLKGSEPKISDKKKEEQREFVSTK